jgi:hypothetical protein
LKSLFSLLAAFLMAVLLVGLKTAPASASDAVQYLGVHKVDSSATNDNRWSVFHPDSFSQAGIYEILNTVGTRGRTDRRLAVSYTFSYLNHDQDHPISKTVDSLKNLLKLAVSCDFPVIVHLDGVNWWSRRPELWNFYAPTAHGYNNENVNNVERYDWGTTEGTAVKLGWRNWGQQQRIAPAPNLASVKFREEQVKALNVVLPVVAQWYNALPSDRKYLLGGVVFGWELSTYWNAYYYENGNDLLTEDSLVWLNRHYPNDPQNGPGNTIPLGYAAAQTLGLQPEKGPIKSETIDAICKDYLEFLINEALRLGMDPKKIITHTLFATNHPGAASISNVTDVIPGWTTSTTSFRNLDQVINKAGGRPWAAIEVHPQEIRADLLKSMFAHRNNRYINIFNWEQIKNNADFTGALKEALIGNGVAPGIAGPTSMTLQAGYAAASTGVYSLAGTTPVAVTKTAGNSRITWNGTTRKLNIAAGLPAGKYSVSLKASNGILPDATLTFALTVTAGNVNPPPGDKPDDDEKDPPGDGEPGDDDTDPPGDDPDGDDTDPPGIGNPGDDWEIFLPPIGDPGDDDTDPPGNGNPDDDWEIYPPPIDNPGGGGNGSGGGGGCGSTGAGCGVLAALLAAYVFRSLKKLG